MTESRRQAFSRASGPSAESIMADIARRAALPKDHPDYAIDDNDKTDVMGIRRLPKAKQKIANSYSGPQTKIPRKKKD